MGVCVRLYVNIHAHSNRFTCMHIYTHIHTHTHTCICWCMHLHAHFFSVYAYTRIYITYMLTHLKQNNDNQNAWYSLVSTRAAVAFLFRQVRQISQKRPINIKRDLCKRRMHMKRDTDSLSALRYADVYSFIYVTWQFYAWDCYSWSFFFLTLMSDKSASERGATCPHLSYTYTFLWHVSFWFFFNHIYI